MCVCVLPSACAISARLKSSAYLSQSAWNCACGSRWRAICHKSCRSSCRASNSPGLLSSGSSGIASAGVRRPGPVVVNAFSARNGEQPRRETAPAIKLANRLKGPHEGVLRHVPGVRAVAAAVGDEAIDSRLVAIDQFFKCDQRAGLALPGQLLVGACWKSEATRHSWNCVIRHCAPCRHGQACRCRQGYSFSAFFCALRAASAFISSMASVRSRRPGRPPRPRHPA